MRLLLKARVAPASVHAGAHQAATSPHNDRRYPTHGQIRAGNYPKGTVRLHGLVIRIENPAGSVRAGIDKANGKVWLTQMRGAHYGYIRDVDGKAAPRGRDKDHLDVFVGPDLESDRVFIVDQVRPDGGFDEHKIVLGTKTVDQARELYAAQYSAGWKVGPISELGVAELKKWLREGDTTKPLARERGLAKAAEALARLFAKADVKRPGSRGGRFRITKHGKVRYGKPTTGDKDAAVQLARGQAAMQRVIATRSDVQDAMVRRGLGSVSFLWGNPGRLNPDGTRYKGGEGVAKIIAQRSLEGKDGESIASLMPKVIALGEVKAIQGQGTTGERVRISDGKHTAVLSLYRHGNRQTWLLTGWEEDDAAGGNPHRAYAPADLGMSPPGGASRKRISPRPPAVKKAAASRASWHVSHCTECGRYSLDHSGPNPDRPIHCPGCYGLARHHAGPFSCEADGEQWIHERIEGDSFAKSDAGRPMPRSVQRPGSRGGMYYISRAGRVVYGEQTRQAQPTWRLLAPGEDRPKGAVIARHKTTGLVYVRVPPKSEAQAERKPMTLRIRRMPQPVGATRTASHSRPERMATPVAAPASGASTEKPAAIRSSRPKGHGLEESAFSAETGAAINFRYRVVPLADLKVNDPEVQPRARTRAASVEQVNRIARTFNPHRHLAGNSELDRGLPIVGPDLKVESGNGRTMALREMGRIAPERMQDLQRLQLEHAEKFGLSAADFKGIKDPVIVRERTTTPAELARIYNVPEAEARKRFADDANARSTLATSPAEQAATDAQRISPAAIEALEVGESQTIEQALASPRNAQVVRDFLKDLPANDRNAMVSASGAKLTPNGLQRLKAAILARVFPGAEGQTLVTAATESSDSNVKNIETGIFGALGPLAKVKAAVEKNTLPAAIDLSADLPPVVHALSRIRQSGGTVDDFIRQGSLLNSGLTASQKKLLARFAAAKSAKAVREFLLAYCGAAMDLPPPSQGGLFGSSEPPSKLSLIDAAERRLERGEPLSKAREFLSGLWRFFSKSNVQQPGSRGGRYWIDGQGLVRYGDRPEPVARTSSGQPVHTVLQPSLATFEDDHHHWRAPDHLEAAEHLLKQPTTHHESLAQAHLHLAARKMARPSRLDAATVDTALSDSWKKGYSEHKKRDAAPPAAPAVAKPAAAAEPKQLSLLADAPKQPAAPSGPFAKPATPSPAPQSAAAGKDDYVYRDVGYVAGSRKELAQEAIRMAAKRGDQVHWQDVDWASLEENPRAAAALITKGNVFGDVDWKAFEAKGVEPGAAYLMRAVYASVATEPDATDLQRRQDAKGEDSGRVHSLKWAAKRSEKEVDATAQTRQDYVRGINTLRERMEACRTHDDVLQVLQEISAERGGTMLSGEEADRYAKLSARLRDLQNEQRQYRAGIEPLATQMHLADSEHSRAQWEQRKRANRNWKPDPELDAEVARLAETRDQARNVYMAAMRKDEEDRRDQEMSRLYREREAIGVAARGRNLRENEITRAWHTLGPRFAGVLAYRDTDGSEAFAKNVAAVKAGKIKDWSWTETEPKARGTSTKQSVRFQLLVADHFDRVGGRPAPIASSADLQKKFNLRAVQSGNWVLDDFNAGKFHMEQSAGAFADLSELVGISEAEVSIHGRLAMAFGARGKGGAKAHYEPVERVINITKMSGAGSLAHEWFHAVDNLVMAAYGAAGADTFGTHLGASNAKLPEPIQKAFSALHQAMTSGDVRSVQEIAITAADDRMAEQNMGHDRISYGSGWRQAIARAASLEEAMRQIEDMHANGRFGRGRRGDIQFGAIRRIAAAWWTKDQAGKDRSVTVPFGQPTSQFVADAKALNSMGGIGKSGYWSELHELAARAFAGYVSDRLGAQGRKNDYLSFAAENRYYAMTGLRPYPEGAERERINKAFDGLFEALRAEQAFAKAAIALAAAKPRRMFFWRRSAA